MDLPRSVAQGLFTQAWLYLPLKPTSSGLTPPPPHPRDSAAKGPHHPRSLGTHC